MMIFHDFHHVSWEESASHPPPSTRGSAASCSRFLCTIAMSLQSPLDNPVRAEHAFPPTKVVYSLRACSLLVQSTLAFVCSSPAGRAAFGGAAFGGGRLRRRPALRAGDWAKLRKWLDSASDNYARSSSSSEQSENCVSKPFIFSHKRRLLCVVRMHLLVQIKINAFYGGSKVRLAHFCLCQMDFLSTRSARFGGHLGVGQTQKACPESLFGTNGNVVIDNDGHTTC